MFGKKERNALTRDRAGLTKSCSRSLTLPVLRSFLVSINSDPNGNGHGQSNAYVQRNDKAKGKDNGRDDEETDFYGNGELRLFAATTNTRTFKTLISQNEFNF